MNVPWSFADLLRHWRSRRGLSQLALAGRANISQRHLSFLELERSAPTRDMVLRLAAALDLPLRQQNALLLGAGFAPFWPQTALRSPELDQIAQAVDYILSQQEPFPAVVVDRHWNLVRANAGAGRLVAHLVGPLPPDATVNLADALVAPDVLRPWLVNWPDVVRYFIRSVEADAAADGSPETEALLARLLAYDGVKSALQGSAPAPTPVLTMDFRKEALSLRLFTTIAVLGTPQDITLQELRIESFFPADAATGEVLRRWATADQAAGASAAS